MSTPDLAAPRTPRAKRSNALRGGINTELYAWIFMRISGVVLLVLIFGHLFVNLMVGEGVSAIDFAFVGGKWSSPFWQVWDLLMLWLAMIHGTNGMRTIINDYAHGRLRIVLLVLLAGATIGLLALGTLVLTTFDPCIGYEPGGALSEICEAR